MRPKMRCPNCGQDEWLESPEISYMPRVIPQKDGSYLSDIDNGIHVRLWRCNNCMYVLQFWEPD